MLRSVDISKTLKGYNWQRIAYLIEGIDGLMRVADGYTIPQWRKSPDQQVHQYGKAKEILFHLKLRIYNELVDQNLKKIGRIDDPEQPFRPVRIGFSSHRSQCFQIAIPDCRPFAVRYYFISRWRELFKILDVHQPPPPKEAQSLLDFHEEPSEQRPSATELEEMKSAAIDREQEED